MHVGFMCEGKLELMKMRTKNEKYYFGKNSNFSCNLQLAINWMKLIGKSFLMTSICLILYSYIIKMSLEAVFSRATAEFWKSLPLCIFRCLMV